jgi:hypothetical protein
MPVRVTEDVWDSLLCMPLVRRAAGIAIVAFVMIVLPAGTAFATDGSRDPFVVLTGSLHVGPGDTVSDAVIFDGDATIDGSVTGNVVAFNGDVTVDGDVGGNAVALNGHVIVSGSGHVHGDVSSRLGPQIDGTVDGSVSRNDVSVNVDRFAFVSRFALWIGTSVSSFLLGLLLLLFAPRAAEAVASVGGSRRGAALGWGALVLVGIPIAAALTFVTIVAIPFGLGVLLALGLLYWLGWVAGAFVLGRRLVREPTSRIAAFAAGWAILRLLALIPLVAGLVWVVATSIGLGALVLAARRANRDVRSQPPAVPVPPPPPLPA